MNSPCMIISQYKSGERSMSMSGVEASLPFSSACPSWLLNPQWQSSHQPTSPRSMTGYPPTAASEDDIRALMDRYWDLVFEFTFPETIDFHDLQAGALACTNRSTMVAEYGWQLWDILASLRAMRVEPEHDALLARNIAKVEGSLETLKYWVEQQRVAQIVEEAESQG